VVTPPPSPLRSTGPLLPLFRVPYNPRTQVDLGQLAGPLEGITPFTVAKPRRTLVVEDERGSPVVEPLIRGTADRSATPTPEQIHHHPHRTQQTLTLTDQASVHQPRLSPLGNWVIRQVIWLPTSTRTQPVVTHPDVVTDVRLSDSTVG
jgi:hypothetical protein